jgi:hypothetical protein
VSGKRSAYTVGLRDQIVNCTIRYNFHPCFHPCPGTDRPSRLGNSRSS